MNPLLFRRIRGPVYLLCFAVTAILAQWAVLPYSRSWPLYLVTAGLLDLFEAAAPVPFLPGMRLPRRRSLAGAAVLLLIGILALLTTADVLPFGSFWRVYATWWPVLLILLGVLLLAERLLDRSYGRRYAAAGGYGPAYVPRRSGHAGLVLLVLALIGLGLISPGSPYLPHDAWRWNPDWNWSFTGETHENDVVLQSPLPPDAALSVDNAHGDLEISPSTDGMIHVEAHQTAHVADRDKERAFRDARPTLAVHGASAAVTVPARGGVDVRLVLRVPESVLCTVRNHHGDVAVSGLRRAIEITEDHGDVTLDSLGAGAHITMDHGDVTARAVTGDLLVDGRVDDVSASGIKGKAVLHGDFFGTTELDNLGSSVDFHSNRTEVAAQHMTGQLSLDSDDLRMSGVRGGLTIHTRSKEVEVTDLSGDAEISDSNSDVTVSAAQPLGALTLTDATGNITLALPAGANFSLNGKTGSDDEIASEFALQQASNDGEKTIRGQVGQGGPHLALSTDHGDLTVHRRNDAPGDAAAAADAKPDTRPEEPKLSSHPRRLRSPEEVPAPTVQ